MKGKEIRTDISVYKIEMGDSFREFENIGEDRIKLVIYHSALALKHFFTTGEYGNPSTSSPETLPSYWPYVRYLVADSLRPKFGYGKPQFVTERYSDKFLEDLVTEALEIAGTLPGDLSHKEWLLLARVSAHMMMNDPFFVNRGLVTESGQDRFRGQTKLADTASFFGEDMYEVQFRNWKSQFGIGPR